MDDCILISNLNDFVFCPVSIYFHNLYGNTDTMMYQSPAQINGEKAHEAIDKGTYSTSKNILTALDVYSEKYRLVGKIDVYEINRQVLTERKRKIRMIYDGYVFQIYAQYFAMREMGYGIKKLQFYSMADNKTYSVALPENDREMFLRFEKVIESMRCFDMDSFVQTNSEKCRNCIYEPSCDRGLL